MHAPGSSWLLAGLVTLAVVLLALAVAFGLGNRPGASSSRRAALLGSATGVAWGFVAAVIKELSSHPSPTPRASDGVLPGNLHPLPGDHDYPPTTPHSPPLANQPMRSVRLRK